MPTPTPALWCSVWTQVTEQLFCVLLFFVGACLRMSGLTVQMEQQEIHLILCVLFSFFIYLLCPCRVEAHVLCIVWTQ